LKCCHSSGRLPCANLSVKRTRAKKSLSPVRFRQESPTKPL
jgi:hypothetical protein